MRAILLSILVSITIISYGQIPLVADLEVAPQPLSENDSILFIATVGMNNQPVYIDFITISDSGSYIIVDACYAGGMMNAYGERKDTFNLGTKPPGVYDLILYAKGGSCDSTWTSTDTLTISIGYNSLKALDKKKSIVFPNPVTNGKFKIQCQKYAGNNYMIFDQLGRKVEEGVIPESHEINVENLRGSYILLIQSQQGTNSVRIQIE